MDALAIHAKMLGRPRLAEGCSLLAQFARDIAKVAREVERAAKKDVAHDR
jgi:hypothetical protein